MHSKIKKIIGNQQGFSLVIALLSLAVLSIVGVSIISISSNTSNAAVMERTDQAVYYIAEAGLIQAKSDLSNIIQDNGTIPGSLYYSSEAGDTGNNPDFKRHLNMKTKANVTINKEVQGTNTLFKLISTGIIEGNGNATSRSVAQLLLVKNDGTIETCPITETEPGKAPSSCFETEDPGTTPEPNPEPNPGNNGRMIYVFDKTTIENGARIADIKISTALSHIDNFNQKYIENMIWNVPLNYQLPPFPDAKFNNFPKTTKDLSSDDKYLKLTNDLRIQNVNLNNNKLNLQIDVGTSDKAIYFENFNLKQADIEVIGTGKLTFYVKNMTVDNKVSIFRNDNLKNIDFFVLNSNFNNSADFYLEGSLYAKTITIDGKFNITGNLLTSTSNDYPFNSSANVSVKGIYSPNAQLINAGKISFEEKIITKKLLLQPSTHISVQ